MSLTMTVYGRAAKDGTVFKGEDGSYVADSTADGAEVTYTDGYGVQRAFFSFDTPALPILEATLNLRVSKTGGTVVVKLFAGADLIDEPELGAGGAEAEFNDTYPHEVATLSFYGPRSEQVVIPVAYCNPGGATDFMIRCEPEAGGGTASLTFTTQESDNRPSLTLVVQPRGAEERVVAAEGGGDEQEIATAARTVAAGDGTSESVLAAATGTASMESGSDEQVIY